LGHNFKSRYHCKKDSAHSPNEVRYDEELDNTVDDADGPALYHHGFGRLIGKEICYTGPHFSRTLLHSQNLHFKCINVFA